MTSRQRFTPQNSPAQSTSYASPASSVSAEEEQRERQGILTDGILHQETTFSTTEQTVPRQFQESEVWTSLRGWTAHQSHGQATFLFYVPRWITEESMDVMIGHDYVIAGVRGQKPNIKASLTGRIDPTTSHWQLEKRSKSKRHRSRSRTRTRTRSSDHSGSSTSGASSIAGANSRQEHTSPPPLRPEQTGNSGALQVSRLSQIKGSEISRNNSRPASPVQSETSSFELLARSTDTIASKPSIVSEDIGSPNITSSPHSLSQSMNLSEEYNPAYNPAQAQATSTTSSYGDVGVRSMDSSISIDSNSHTASSEDNDPTRDARLVTLHLDKIEGGIWPCVVSGPVPTERVDSTTSFQPIARLISVQSQGSLNAAISEAIRQQQNFNSHERHASISSSAGASDHSEDPSGHSHGREPQGDDSEDNFNHSTLTIDTVASDDSTTVLGSNSNQRIDEEDYNMDPITLTLMGMQYARKKSIMPFEMHAFECYRRAWREAEIPAAIEHLVHDYLPLSLINGTPALTPIRQRLTAALGGPTALAKLYISYAHLHMRSYDFKRPLLALPLSGTTNNPYGQSYIIQELQTLSDSEMQPAGPLQYLLESRQLDSSVEIGEKDWKEAEQIDEERNLAWKSTNWSGAASPTSKSEGGKFESDTGSQPSSTNQIRKGKRKRKTGSRRDKLGKHHHHHHHSSTPSDQGIVFLVVSRAALLSVVVAGGMAVAGWWRRAAAAGAGG